MCGSVDENFGLAGCEFRLTGFAGIRFGNVSSMTDCDVIAWTANYRAELLPRQSFTAQGVM